MKFKVTLQWKKSYQAEVVEADTQEAAQNLVLSGYDFVNSANYPDKIEIKQTDEDLGLQPYIHNGLQ